MVKRHGVLLCATNQPQWRLGIRQIFDPWVDPHLQWLQGHTVPQITRPLTIEFHFRRVVQRLVRSLARLYRRVREWDHFLETGGLASAHPELAFDIPEEGGMAADSVFHYLNLFIDDLARVVPFILADHGTAVEEPDGFSKLKRMLHDGEVPAAPPLRELFDELDHDGSWWSHGFKRGAGIRQRLTHYTDVVYFRGSTKPGDHRMTGDVSLISVGGPVHLPDFEGVLQELFGKLCEWLERLDQLLLRHLSEKLAAKGVSWEPNTGECPAVTLPPEEGVQLDASHYLYLPVAGDAEPPLAGDGEQRPLRSRCSPRLTRGARLHSEGGRSACDRRKETTMWYSAVGCIVTCILSLLAVPFVTTAQQRGNIPLIGVLEPNPAISPGSCGAAFQQGLRDLGYVEGQHLTFTYRYAANQFDRLPALAAELVRLTPDVLWTHSNAPALAAKQATTTIPIVIGVANELVALSLVESLARPGGNLTGLDLRRNDLMGKRLELLKDAVPTLSRVAVLVDPMNPLYTGVPQNIAPEARALSVHLQRIEARSLDAFEGAFATMVQWGADALMLPEGPPFGTRERQRLLELALQHRLPTICSHRGWAEAGCLLTYGASVEDLCERSARMVDKILKGATPATLPVELAHKFSLAVNLKTAEALGLRLSPTFLAQADEVIK